ETLETPYGRLITHAKVARERSHVLISDRLRPRTRAHFSLDPLVSGNIEDDLSQSARLPLVQLTQLVEHPFRRHEKRGGKGIRALLDQLRGILAPRGRDRLLAIEESVGVLVSVGKTPPNGPVSS